MDLFKIEGKVVKPTEHALLLYPFSEIWDRDKGSDKGQALKEYKFIEFMCSYKRSNPFKGFPKDRIQTEVSKSVFKDPDYEPDDLIVECMEEYKKFRDEAAPTLVYYLSAKSGAEKMMKWFNDFDMNTVNERSGNPLYKPKDVTSGLKDTQDILKTLNALEEKVYEEIYESTKTKGNKEINHFEQ